MKRTKKGFTLAELLIVVAILAILVAIMMPVFGAQLNKARLAADLANVRSAYSEAVANALLGSATKGELGGDVSDTAEINVSELAKACNYANKNDSNYTAVGQNNMVTADSNDGVYYSTDTADKWIAVVYGGYFGSFDVDSDVTLTS